MRDVRDRIRHSISFEIIGLLLVTPLGAIAFGLPVHDIGVVSLAGAIVALGWNYLFNWGFDRAMLRLAGTLWKSVAVRMLHALLFELGLLALLTPALALYLGIGLIEALVLDLSLAGFYMVYAFCFNWGYDRLFPAPISRR